MIDIIGMRMIRDQSSAVIPGATVTLASTRTSISRTAITNEAGVSGVNYFSQPLSQNTG